MCHAILEFIDLNHFLLGTVANVDRPALVYDTLHLKDILKLPFIIHLLVNEERDCSVIDKVLCHHTVMGIFFVVSNTLAIRQRLILVN